MGELLPPVGEFAAAFVEFMRAMREAAETPEPILLARIWEHLGVEPGEPPVTSAGFGVAEQLNLQLALGAVLSGGRRSGSLTRIWARWIAASSDCSRVTRRCSCGATLIHSQ